MLAPAPDEGPDVEVDLDVEDDVIVMEEDGIEVGGERPESMHVGAIQRSPAGDHQR